jgi:hypothetical protein
MGKWLDALRTSKKKSENATEANPQNPRNHPEIGFGGFGGSGAGTFSKIDGDGLGGFGGFGGSPHEHFQNFFDLSAWDEEDWQVAFEERAAILEYDEGLPRATAEALAAEQVKDQRRRLLQ